MVIFGAGASYDSLARSPPTNPPQDDPLRNLRPPLANQLFEPRWGPFIQQFHQAGSLISDLEKGTEVEEQLERFQNDAQQYPKLRVPLTAIRYYLQAMLSSCQANWNNETNGVTNYKPLVFAIDRWVTGEKVFVSFNYDTLLEEAIRSTLGRRFFTLDAYIGGGLKVIKPHGSINWWHYVDSPQLTQRHIFPDDRTSALIDSADEMRINPAFEIDAPKSVIDHAKSLIPALSIPVATKSEYECPDDHQSALAQSFPKITKVLVIGWRATENRFLNSFARGIGKNRPSFLVVSKDDVSALQVEQTIKSRLEENGASAEYSHLPYGFSTAIKNHDFDGFLKS